MPILDVGGVLYRTSWSTLESTESFFSGLAAQCFRLEDEVVFIDRDPTHFRLILNFLRGGVVMPTDARSLHELRIEADFYCLPQLVSTIDEKLAPTTRPGDRDTDELLADLVDAVRGVARAVTNAV